jgi:hypothetical protein
MAQLSRPVVYGGLALLAIGAFWWSGQEPETTAAIAHKKTHTSLAAYDPDLTDADFGAHFDKPNLRLRNAFLPLVLPPDQQSQADGKKEDIITIPGSFAEGDSSWQYKGFAIVNSSRIAVLENPGKHEAATVHEGDTWKKSKVKSITSGSIVLTNADGEQVVVLRYTPDLEKKPGSGNAPVKPADLSAALHGPIGQNLQIVPSPPGRPGPRMITSGPVMMMGGDE